MNEALVSGAMGLGTPSAKFRVTKVDEIGYPEYLSFTTRFRCIKSDNSSQRLVGVETPKRHLTNHS